MTRASVPQKLLIGGVGDPDRRLPKRLPPVELKRRRYGRLRFRHFPCRVVPHSMSIASERHPVASLPSGPGGPTSTKPREAQV